MTVRAGMIGLGNIGMPMAKRMVGAGLTVAVHDLVPARVDELVAAGAGAAPSPGALAARCATIGVCVRDDADVRTVVAALLPEARPGTVIALHGTFHLDTVLAVGEHARARGVGVVDACVTGGAAGAAAGTLTTMVGGEPADVEAVRPVLAAFSKTIVPTGALGSGTVVKLCNNLMGYLAWTAVFEAGLLARAAGIAPDVLETATRAGGHLTEAMAGFLRLHQLPDGTRLSPEHQSRMRAFVEIAEKDLAATVALARRHGLAVPGTAMCAELMARVYGLEDPGRR
jgi:3-hydroxyisobutyrate dehydrogenase-like beta-hydroxyacid dehydrogenase